MEGSEVLANEPSNPLVSVIIPVYNAEGYLEECLQSVLGQSFADFEVLCVDNGSTDSSASILQAYANKDSRVKVISCPPSNAGTARNVALGQARGTYLAFLDADDYYESAMLGSMVELAQELDLDVALCKSFVYDDSSGEKDERPSDILDSLDAGAVYSADDLWGKAFRYAVGWPWDKLFKRSFIEEHGLRFQELSNTNDAYFVCMALLLARRFAYLDEYLVVHRVNNMGSIENTRDKAWQNVFKAFDAVEQGMKDNGIYEVGRQDFENWMIAKLVWNLRTLRSNQEELFEYVKQHRLPELMDHPDDYYLEGDYPWRLRVWHDCDYDLASATFEMKRDLVLSRRQTRQKFLATRQQLKEAQRENRALAHEKAVLEARIKSLEESNSYRVGRAITAPARALKSVISKPDSE